MSEPLSHILTPKIYTLPAKVLDSNVPGEKPIFNRGSSNGNPVSDIGITVPLVPDSPHSVKLPELTQLQKDKVMELWNASPDSPPQISALTQAVFGREHDGRSHEGRMIKNFLAKSNLKPLTSQTYDQLTDKIVLSEAHKAYIQNNVRNMNSLEMARAIFANPSITALNAECRVVQKHRNTLMTNPLRTTLAGNSNIPVTRYVPPKTIDEAITRVNSYMNFAIDKTKVTNTQRKCLSMLIGYLHTYRLLAQMSNYISERDKSLAEDAFIRATYDKPDLAQEEIDQYIEYANQVVNGFKVQRRSEQLSQQLEDITTSNDESLKISMSLVEAIGKASTEYHQCLARQQKLLDDLKQKRSTRISKQVQETASILNLVQLWREEESRTELLAHAKKEQEAVSNEVDRLSSLSDIKARILGLTKNEIKYG